MMDEKTLNVIARWIDEKCTTLKCPMCGSADFEGATIAYGTIAATPLSIVMEPAQMPAQTHLPLLYVFCKDCAYALSFSAFNMGLTFVDTDLEQE